MSFWDKPDFKRLSEEWDKKLRKAGFEDVENKDGMLKEWSTNFFRNQFVPEVYEANLSYYQMITDIFQNYPFKTKKERFIFEKHAEGGKFREISRLFKAKGVSMSPKQVSKRVKDIIVLYRAKNASE